MNLQEIITEEVKKCLLCNSNGELFYPDLRDHLFGVPGVWTLMRCPRCRFVWLNPRPHPDDIGKVYQTYYTHATEELAPVTVSLRQKIKQSLLASYFDYRHHVNSKSSMWIGRLFGLIPFVRKRVGNNIRWLNGVPNGKLLDVGCGSGGFLAQMREIGWDVTGVDPDPKAAINARDRFDINVHIGTLEEIGFSENFFDAVTLSHVIEHVHNPTDLIKECLKILKPGGKLIIFTPNVESLGHKIFKESWRGLEPPRHLHLFSLNTLRNCAEQAGFRVEKLRTETRSASWTWAACTLLRKDGKLPGGSPANISRKLRLEGKAFQFLEQGLSNIMNVGEECMMIAVKKYE